MKSFASTIMSLSTLALATTALLPLAGCSTTDPARGSDPPPSTRAKPADVTYTCPMHPEVVRSSPGKCPKCGMNLVRKE